MTETLNEFQVYGFTIEVHAGGRRVWPPSFKRFVKNKLARGELTVAQVMKTCNVSQSLIYKWRADVKALQRMTKTVSEERLFSEVIIEEEMQSEDTSTHQDCQLASDLDPLSASKIDPRVFSWPVAA